MHKNTRKAEGMVQSRESSHSEHVIIRPHPVFHQPRRICHVPHASRLCYNTSACSRLSFWNSLPHLCLSNIYALSSKSSVKVTLLIEPQ